MNDETRGLDCVAGEVEVANGFEQTDMSFRLRMRAYIGICMPGLLSAMQREVALTSLRRHGIAPVLYYCDFSNGPNAIGFGRRLRMAFEGRFCRQTDAGDRLLMHSTHRIWGRARRQDSHALGFEATQGEPVEAGCAEIIHVFTRPTAAPGEHRVSRLPAPADRLQVHDYPGSLPSPRDLQDLARGLTPVALADAETACGVYGLPNTDVNQHVNVLEYIMGFENHFTTLVHAAGLGVNHHRIIRARMVFRKPFFPGQGYRLTGRLYRDGERTAMAADFFAAGSGADRPSVSGFVEGQLDE